MKILLSGNEAIARGAYEAGCLVAAAYPGTPSTEILESISGYPEINAEWSPNEKVAVDVCAGASYAGARALAAMKHVGLNVAADPVFTLSYTGVRGGLVIVVADDPSIHSSQNEQDSRHYARSAKLPMLEPSDSQEALEFTKLAFELSEEFDCPVLIRSCTRISHGQSLVEPGGRRQGGVKIRLHIDKEKFVMLPAYARLRHPLVEARMKRLEKFADKFEANRIEDGERGFGFITSGAAYQYTREAFPDAAVLKLGMIYPVPEKLIRRFAKMVRKLYVVEELDPFIEDHVRMLGIDAIGKKVFPACGELNPSLVRAGVLGRAHAKRVEFDTALPARPPIMCPGCAYRGLFYVLRKFKVFVCGDIGCYTLGAEKPLSAIHATLCMGAGVGISFGMEKALGKDGKGKVVSVIGDSTFLHAGIAPLMDIAYNRGVSTVIILDNGTTAMTGRQGHPGAGYDIHGEPAPKVDLEMLAKSLGIKRVRVVDPYDIKAAEEALREELDAAEPSLIISRKPCVLIPEFKKFRKPALAVDVGICDGCKRCLQIACPAITWEKDTDKRKKRKGFARIDDLMCTGCGICRAVCEAGAILEGRWEKV